MAHMFRALQSVVETTEKAPEGAFSVEAYCVCEAQMRIALARIALHLSAGRRVGRHAQARAALRLGMRLAIGTAIGGEGLGALCGNGSVARASCGGVEPLRASRMSAGGSGGTTPP